MKVSCRVVLSKESSREMVVLLRDVYKRQEYCTIELKKVYRQNDGTFLELLNRIRENRCDGQVLEALNRRYTKAGRQISREKRHRLRMQISIDVFITLLY